jgi:hypothetical protein
MTKIIPFKGEHLKKIVMQEESLAYMRHMLSDEMLLRLEHNPFAVSVETDGEVVMCGGLSIYWENRGEVWAVYDSHKLKKNFVPVFRISKKWIDALSVRRIEASVDIGNKFAERQIQLLGFEKECSLMRKFRPDGRDCALYAKVK